MQKSYASPTSRSALLTWPDYVNLTKPRVNALLLLTTLAAMLIAGEAIPPLSIILLTLGGGYLAAGGAGALNCYLDCDIDALMSRTSRRPLPTGRIQPRQALFFGLVLSLLSCLILWLGVNWLVALLSLTGILFYVFVYTGWLKRRSTQNIVIGGAAGAIPPLIGWAAATGSLSLTALLLFAIIFYWTPPHFWALALVRRQDYTRAAIPMLPVVKGGRMTRRQIFRYAVVMVTLTLLPVVLEAMHFVYALSALCLGMLFIFYTVRLWREATIPAAWRLYKYSLLYLTLLFLAMVVDKIVSIFLA